MASRKVALVTGSGKKRIGYHVAHALAEKGYSLVIHYHSSAEEARDTVAGFQEAVALQADLADESSVKAMIDETLARFGRLDVAVNCAAQFHFKPLEKVTAGDVRAFLEVNTLGTFLLCQHAGLAMVKQPEGGCVVTVGDWACERPYLNYPAYFASKGAIPTLTRTFAVELGTRNPKVRVNGILPGPVMFPEDMPQVEREAAIRATLLKHEGSPENVAQAVLALVENDFVTGVCLPVDGGRTIYAPE